MPRKNAIVLHPKMKVAVDTLQQLRFHNRSGDGIESEFVYLPILYVDGKLTGIAGASAQTNVMKARAIAHAHAKDLRRKIRDSKYNK